MYTIDAMLVIVAIVITLITVAIILYCLRVHDSCYVAREIFHMYGNQIINNSSTINCALDDIKSIIDQTPTIHRTRFVIETNRLIDLYNKGEISTTMFGERLTKV